MRRRAFTLLEVLIAVAVTALLASMLLPVTAAIGRGQERSETRLMRAAALGRLFDQLEAAVATPGARVRGGANRLAVEAGGEGESIDVSLDEQGLTVRVGASSSVVAGVGGFGVRSLVGREWGKGVSSGARAVELRVWYEGRSADSDPPDLVRLVPIGFGGEERGETPDGGADGFGGEP